MKQYLAASLVLQDVANTIQDKLLKATGQDIAFALVISVDNTAQYVSNCSREDGKMLLKDLLKRWESNRADIPAHYNPDLPSGRSGE